MYFQKSKIVIIVSTNKTRLVHFCNQELLSKQEISNDLDSITKLEKYVNKNKKSSVYITYEPSDEDYKHHYLNIPITSNKNSFLNTIVCKEKLRQAAFAELILLNKNHYLSVTPIINPDWVNFANNIHKQLKGFIIAPLEYKQVIQVLSLGLNSPSASEKTDLLLMCNKQEVEVVIYRNGVFLSHHSKKLEKEKNTTIYSGYIKEHFDSVVNDLNIKKNATLNGYIIAPNAIKNKLFLHNFNRENVVIISPYEAGIMLDLDWLIAQNELNCNLLSVNNIANSGKSNFLFNSYQAKKKNRIFILESLTNFAMALSVMLFVIIAFYMNNSIFGDYLTQMELLDENRTKQDEINKLVQSYRKIKHLTSQNITNFINALDSNDGNEVLQYIIRLSKQHDDLISSINYNKRQNNEKPVVKIRTKNKQSIKNKENDSKIKAEIHYEEDIR
ncbi:MAG: hypothetical protein HRK26_00860 [Rickettsiaceae bacterium H1]|nr:hypothetical protein [Rickettsiaceae bacterium H1]